MSDSKVLSHTSPADFAQTAVDGKKVPHQASLKVEEEVCCLTILDCDKGTELPHRYDTRLIRPAWLLCCISLEQGQSGHPLRLHPNDLVVSPALKAYSVTPIPPNYVLVIRSDLFCWV